MLKREFSTADEEMKKIVLKVVQQCVATEGVEGEYVKTEVLPEFFRAFWQRRMALDRRNYRALVETTVSLANRVSLWGGVLLVGELLGGAWVLLVGGWTVWVGGWADCAGGCGQRGWVSGLCGRGPVGALRLCA